MRLFPSLLLYSTVDINVLHRHTQYVYEENDRIRAHLDYMTQPCDVGHMTL